jgi:hypothetical protein
METIVNWISSYGGIVVGDFLVAELFGLCSLVLILGIYIGKWVYQPKKRGSSLE